MGIRSTVGAGYYKLRSGTAMFRSMAGKREMVEMGKCTPQRLVKYFLGVDIELAVTAMNHINDNPEVHTACAELLAKYAVEGMSDPARRRLFGTGLKNMHMASVTAVRHYLHSDNKVKNKRHVGFSIHGPRSAHKNKPYEYKYKYYHLYPQRARAQYILNEALKLAVVDIAVKERIGAFLSSAPPLEEDLGKEEIVFRTKD
ncbi:MAG: hypothetical protein ABIA67_04555 [Candidatus Margulisiibacteriota bacterium]